jgi:hypothetical protein
MTEIAQVTPVDANVGNLAPTIAQTVNVGKQEDKPGDAVTTATSTSRSYAGLVIIGLVVAGYLWYRSKKKSAT